MRPGVAMSAAAAPQHTARIARCGEEEEPGAADAATMCGVLLLLTKRPGSEWFGEREGGAWEGHGA